ncbi:MAG TPA: tetratricopeptide repeat protein [Blastocatellia bacterium]|nr:tetratricopeptide repeat protein [Blastocatellia bacterium]
MKRQALLATLMGFVVLASVQSAGGQIGGGHTLFGDFKVDESQYSGIKPQTFFVLLYSPSGVLISRQTVSNNGRYRFNDVSNGEYDIVVEVENDVVAKVRIHLMEGTKTDIRHDLNLEWRVKGPQGQGALGSIAAPDDYKRPPENAARFANAQVAIKRKEYKEAIALLRQALATDPKDYVVWTELGTTQFKQGDTAEAEKSYLGALQQKPTFLLALTNLGKLRMSEKKFDGAIEFFTRAVEVEPRSADANYYLGESYLQIKKGSKAVGYLEEALRLDPIGKADAHIRLGALYKGAGMKEKAAAEYEKFLAKKPDCPEKKQLEQYISENKKR